MIKKIIDVRLLNDGIQYLPFKGNWKYLLTKEKIDAINSNTDLSESNPVASKQDVEYITNKNIVQSINSNIDWNYNYFTKEVEENTRLFDINLPSTVIGKTIKLLVNPNSAILNLPSYWEILEGELQAQSNNLIEATCFNPISAKQVDTITVTGTLGTATITVGSVEKVVTFDTDIATSLASFVEDNEADYLAEKIVVTTNGVSLIFTSLYAGYPFDGTSTIENTTEDLTGSVVNTTDNVSPVIVATIKYKVLAT